MPRSSTFPPAYQTAWAARSICIAVLAGLICVGACQSASAQQRQQSGNSLFGNSGAGGSSGRGGSASANAFGSGGMSGGMGGSGFGAGGAGGAGGQGGFGAGGFGSGIGTGATQALQSQQGGFAGRSNDAGFIGRNNAAKQAQDQAGLQALIGISSAMNRDRNNDQGGMNQNASNGTAPRLRPQQRVAFRYSRPAAPQLTTTLQQRVTRMGVRNPVLRGVQVSVAPAGEAVLRGRVDSAASAKLAEQLVRLEPGVRSIKNELVYPPAAAASGAE